MRLPESRIKYKDLKTGQKFEEAHVLHLDGRLEHLGLNVDAEEKEMHVVK